ncbi:class I SAM-dependent methyltransferase [Ferrovum myxofaciens]|uniref:Class I SAM-dependent methyltransferase n=1 Tax=Ferrovum myxofaciens TaxID=416213 RepID=A0A9E6MXQ2_9PROT|nr:class I SAM-dependent methyltransferase [Ferrovum myxofaciens]QKE37338.1 MAG: class I SAM-dependent methyltransferase [Ferrovum myxofaciens]QWY74986.1 MAG: class I SAM-dependent methyltransferase [Ferrovum myxofaciens]QWY77734.1 MAG: class I SAM-dependent methyltransferase [Ferrovum myxofaciens]
MTETNIYGDKLVSLSAGHGVDVSSQRADWMDQDACEHLTRLCLSTTNESSSSETEVRALDIGCGFGGQVFRMAQTGAHSVGIDNTYFEPSQRMTEAARIAPGGSIEFHQQNLMLLPMIGKKLRKHHFDVVVCQRTIHYLKYAMAKCALERIGSVLKPGGLLYLSASGLGSELSNGYLAANLPVHERFAELGRFMAQRHQILSPVCLYTLEELTNLVQNAGFAVTRSEVSAFGNIKVAATKP